MRKKRTNKLNVSQLFVLKQHETSESKLIKKCDSFSRVVSGVNPESSEYKNIWPDLSCGGLKNKTNIKNDLNILQVVNKVKGLNICKESYDDKNKSSPKLLETNSNFPNLEESSKSRGKRKKNKSVALSEPVASTSNNCDTNSSKKAKGGAVGPSVSSDGSRSKVTLSKSGVDDSLVKTRQFGKRKVKRNDPISINLEAAMQVSKMSQKKELKRLKRKPAVTMTCGNALDSTNPARRKGKVRLDRKKKLSSLRRCIEKLRSKPTEERDLDGALCKVHEGVSLTQIHLDRIKQAKLHNSKFREYCKNMASKELVESVKDLVMTLRCYQDRSYKNNEIKARQRRRFAVGFHECYKLLRAESFKFIIMATNIERNEALFEKIREFELESGRQGVPVIFAGTCTDLSYWLLKKNRTCVVGIINYDGANELYNKMIELYERDKACYEVKLNQILQDTSQPMLTDAENIEEEIRINMMDKLVA